MPLVNFKLHHGKTLEEKQRKNSRKHHETLPASAYVAAGNGGRCVEAPDFINFNYFNAAGVIMDRFCSLGDQQQRGYYPLFHTLHDSACNRSARMAADSPD